MAKMGKKGPVSKTERPTRKGASEKPETPRPVFPGVLLTDEPPLLAAVIKQGPTMMLVRREGLLAIKNAQDRRRALREALERLEAILKPAEKDVIAALRVHVPMEPGCPPCAVDREERITPRWKDEALALAVKAGLNAEVYEAEIRAKTPPAVIERLIINGKEGEHGRI